MSAVISRSVQPPARRWTKGAVSAVLAAALIFVSVPVAQARGPETIADVSERVIDAVVNIKASQRVEQRGVPLPQVPPGSPFEDFFNDFFNRRGENGPGPQRRGPQRSNSLGSGFVVDAEGIIITNNHVIQDADEIIAVFTDGSELKADVVGRDKKTDLAVLKVKPTKPLKSVKFGNSDALRVGEWVIAIGNPFGFGGSVSAGIVSAKQRNIRSGPYDTFIQTDAAINKGNSGGPLFNLDGDVVGVNTAIISPTGGSIGIGFAVPSSLAVSVVEQLRNFGETRRGWLGVAIQDVDDGIAESLNIAKRGAFVANVDPNGPAKPAGIEREDVIIRFDNREIRASRDLPLVVAETPVGKKVDIVLLRQGKEMTRQVTVGRLDENEPKPASATSTESVSPKQLLGLEISPISPEVKSRFSIKDGIEGVVITKVDANSPAAERRLQAGDVIVEVQREAVKTVADFTRRIDDLKKKGQKRALFYVANAQGDLRYVTLPIE